MATYDSDYIVNRYIFRTNFDGPVTSYEFNNNTIENAKMKTTDDEFAPMIQQLAHLHVGNAEQNQTIPNRNTYGIPWTSKKIPLKSKPKICVFCKNNGEPKYTYTSHQLKDNNNRVCCPRLRRYKCKICGAFGDNAHTIRYCPTREASLRSASVNANINDHIAAYAATQYTSDASIVHFK